MGWITEGGAMAQPRKRVAIIGGGVGAAECALTLAQLGVKVDVITPFMDLGSSSNAEVIRDPASQDLLRVRPVLLRAASHPLVSLHTNAKVETVVGRRGEFTIRGTKNPRYVIQDLCTSCGQCAEACSTRVPFVKGGERLYHSAIHAPHLSINAVPSAYSIDKMGIAPCTAACPLGINVTGFVSLLAQGKVDNALALINEAAPLAGVLGRVCTHPCEDSCKRAEVDEPLFLRALHRYAADHATEGIKYRRKAPPGSRRERVAIVGSGPAGLTAAWELARRGYWPVIFESHAVVGGMLATGIPRFRLPREVREREVKAIEDMGVEIRTGVTVGRDVTIPDLRERGYRAFFLAIGAHENRRLNIPGEDLEGIVDSISLLFELNLRVGATVGRNMVVIGGGNSAVDSARTARRRGRRNVTILYRRTAEEMTAVKEDIEEALKEGISIQYLTSPVEILGDGTRVTGVRCQRMMLGEAGPDGRRRPVPIPGSEFVIDADHVVLAIGQRPNTAQLRKKDLNVNAEDATIKIDPVTLETSVPGVFAGGDCVTGPNNVVEATAAGLRAAESIDRYLRGRSLIKGERVERPQPAEVNVAERYASPDRRAKMPFILRSQRLGTFEETSKGLPPDVAKREAGRCLDCPLCSGCMECEEACELGAVFHADSTERIELAADVIVNYVPGNGKSANHVPDYGAVRAGASPPGGPVMYTVRSEGDHSLWAELDLASSVALEVASKLSLRGDERVAGPEPGVEEHADSPRSEAAPSHVQADRAGVVLCHCGNSISSVIDFVEVSKRALGLADVCSVQQISQACTPKGAQQIAEHAAAWQLGRVVVAACRCCGQEQICFSCTDRRIMCREYLEESLTLPFGTDLEFVNIREQCAWVHRDDPVNATNKALDMISAAVARGRGFLPPAVHHPVEGSALVVGDGLGGLAAASQLAAQGYAVTVVAAPNLEAGGHEPGYLRRREHLLEQLQKQGIDVRPWPEVMDLGGSPGDYAAVLGYGGETTRIGAGAVILNLGRSDSGLSLDSAAIPEHSLLGRVLSHKNSFGDPDGDGSTPIREITIGETAGIFVVSSRKDGTPEERIMQGEAAAVRAWAYLAQGTTSPRATAVAIDSKLCRGCGECTRVCPYIDMKTVGDGLSCAYVDPTLCLGCGACIACCPTGAISQAVQSDEQISSVLEALLDKTMIPCEVG
jgi:NADPH-dependent glutamate synthase beta subunit-like oxidoreductase/NAD-dependent dihydropyrimidine dehydrogenase PreA subunit